MKILVVEDDLDIAETLRILLNRFNYSVDLATNGEMGLSLINAYEYDLVLLDVILPGIDGVSVCQQLRTQGFQCPVLLLTGQDSGQQKAIALNAGADDYVVKPFDAHELIARVQALLRRGQTTSPPILTWGDLSVHPSHRVVTYGTRSLTLTPKEYAILELFLRNPQHLFSARLILERAWTSLESPGEEAVRVHIKELRHKLTAVGAPKDFIKTIHRVGYQLNPLYSTTATPQRLEPADSKPKPDLALSNDEYQIISELTSDFIYRSTVSGTGKITDHWMTSKISEFTGYSLEELSEHEDKWFELIYPDDLLIVRQFVQDVIHQNQANWLEYRIVDRQGTVRWVRDRVQPVWDATLQRVVRLVGAVEDISVRKQSELELQEVSIALSHAIEGISRLDKDGCYLAVNDAYAAIVGYTPPEMIGLSWQQTVHPDDLDAVSTAYQKMVVIGKVEVHARGIRKDGSVFHKHLFMIATYSEQAQLLGHYCFMRDISEQRQLELDRQQAEAELQQSEQKLRAIFDSTFQFMGVLTPEGTVMDANQTALDVIAADLAEVVGQPLWQTPWWQHFPEQQEQLKQAIARAARGEFIRLETKHLWADGTLAFVDFSLKPVFDEAGKVVMLVPEGRDITEKKQLEAQFHQAQRLESLGTLTSGIAHDLNNILTPILVIAQILRTHEETPDDRTQALLQTLENSAKRGINLIKQILVFARGMDGKRVQVPLQSVLLEVLKVMEQTVPPSIELQATFPPTPLWLVLADPTQMHQVFMNLCVNARDAMPNGGVLSVAAQNCVVDESFAETNLGARVGNYVCVTIADTGTGIPLAVRDRIFDPFFTTKPLGEGTGLGLSTVLGIIKNHQGFVQVSSEVGQGSQFKVYLPAISDSQ